ncbi:MAG: hypothetical protein IBX64_04915 [Actinobacteria bacterium]|nr:hypothetical protein [Actinomycetota bacterium]
MPELPEVEIVRRALAKTIVGKEIASFEVIRTPGKPVRTLQGISEEEFRDAVIGEAFTDMTRKGKFIIAPLTSGKTVIFHFMLSGWLDYFQNEGQIGERERRYARLKFAFTSGQILLFTDPRNMGRVFLVEDEDFTQLGVLARLGIEPLSLDFTIDRFSDIIAKTPGKAIKDLLTDQEKIAGIGNIYSDEILRRAGVRPDRQVGTLTGTEVEKLHYAIPEVLKDAIAEIEAGKEEHMLAWRKKGRSCPDCGGEVVAEKRGASHYYWCPRCQK